MRSAILTALALLLAATASAQTYRADQVRFDDAEDLQAKFDGGSLGGGHTIEDEGTPLTARTGLNFTGAGVTCTDDAGNDETDCTIPGVSGAPTDAPYLTGAAVGGLSAEVVIDTLSALNTHLGTSIADGPHATGDVVGPGTATDHAVARYDLATGKVLQNSAVIIDDTGNLATTGAASTGPVTASNPNTTAGGDISLKEASSTGEGHAWGLQAADDLAASKNCQVDVDGRIPLDCVQGLLPFTNSWTWVIDDPADDVAEDTLLTLSAGPGGVGTGDCILDDVNDTIDCAAGTYMVEWWLPMQVNATAATEECFKAQWFLDDDSTPVSIDQDFYVSENDLTGGTGAIAPSGHADGRLVVTHASSDGMKLWTAPCIQSSNYAADNASAGKGWVRFTKQ